MLYAVVNLHKLTLPLVFLRPIANAVVFVHMSRMSYDFGGLKWTRTIDLPLIRRVL